ncbi:MAG: M24 family metallopeptidase [Acidimicrobiales bacterium]
MTDTDLVRDRFARARAAARAVDVDVLILGRSDNVRYLTGASQLWTAGSRPFGAVATLVVATGDIYMLSTWEEGMTDLVPFEHLHGISWNPSIVANRLAAIDGLAEADRIGVDGLSPGFSRLLTTIAPDAEIVAADHCLQGARRVKLPAEVDAIQRACTVAGDVLAAVRAAVGSGRTEHELTAVALSAASRIGRIQPAAVPTVHATSTTHYERPQGSRSRTIDAGALVRIDVAFLVDGYEGGLGRTVAVDLAGPTINGLEEQLDAHQQQLLQRCRSGASGRDLADGTPVHWQIRGLGMGFEAPIIDHRTGHHTLLEAGMVLSVESAVFLESFGTMSRRDVVVVRDGEPDVLT